MEVVGSGHGDRSTGSKVGVAKELLGPRRSRRAASSQKRVRPAGSRGISKRPTRVDVGLEGPRRLAVTLTCISCAGVTQPSTRQNSLVERADPQQQRERLRRRTRSSSRRRTAGAVQLAAALDEVQQLVLGVEVLGARWRPAPCR